MSVAKEMESQNSQKRTKRIAQDYTNENVNASPELSAPPASKRQRQDIDGKTWLDNPTEDTNDNETLLITIECSGVWLSLSRTVDNPHSLEIVAFDPETTRYWLGKMPGLLRWRQAYESFVSLAYNNSYLICCVGPFSALLSPTACDALPVVFDVQYASRRKPTIESSVIAEDTGNAAPNVENESDADINDESLLSKVNKACGAYDDDDDDDDEDTEKTKSDAIAAFRRACATGHHETAQVIIEIFTLTRQEACGANDEAFIAACENESPATAKWICDWFGFAPATQDAPHLTLHPAVARWLGVNRAQIATDAAANHVFFTACKLESLKPEYYFWSDIDARARDNHALRWACAAGAFPFARWITETFNLTADDARSKDNYAFRWSCANGHFALAKWLYRRFNLNLTDTSTQENFAFRMALAQNHREVVLWLEDLFKRENAKMNT